MAPYRLTNPYVGRNPVTPQNAAGVKIDPLVSEPNANGTNPAATAAADPDDEPPLQCERLHGFNPGPDTDAAGNRYPPPPANSTIASFDVNTAPVPANFLITVASWSNTCPA